VLGIEDPVNRQSLGDYRKLREIGLNVVLHVALPYCAYGQRAEDALRGLKEDALDAFNFNGSMASFVQLAEIAHLANKPCWHGSEVDLGLLEAGYVHASSAAPACTWPSDIFGRLVREHDLLAEPLRFDGKSIIVPTGPGLGVELDESAMEKYRVGDDIDLTN
jgi:muconate cycloisomerase